MERSWNICRADLAAIETRYREAKAAALAEYEHERAAALARHRARLKPRYATRNGRFARPTARAESGPRQ